MCKICRSLSAHALSQGLTWKEMATNSANARILATNAALQLFKTTAKGKVIKDDPATTAISFRANDGIPLHHLFKRVTEAAKLRSVGCVNCLFWDLSSPRGAECCLRSRPWAPLCSKPVGHAVLPESSWSLFLPRSVVSVRIFAYRQTLILLQAMDYLSLIASEQVQEMYAKAASNERVDQALAQCIQESINVYGRNSWFLWMVNPALLEWMAAPGRRAKLLKVFDVFSKVFPVSSIAESA